MKILDTLIASFTMLTRLPAWRLRRIPDESYSRAVEGWSAVGWLTGGITGGALWLLSQILPPTAAVTAAVGIRLLLTGAMHEDGLSDFFDGFGGGRDRQSTLDIMKDSRIGAYGVIALIIYFLLLISTLSALPAAIAAAAVAACDPLAKFIASQIINILPYARTAEQSKNGTVYSRMSGAGYAMSLAFGIIPAIVLFRAQWWYAVIAAAMVFALLTAIMRRRIGGYTGDCCGALFLMCELSLYLTISVFAI